MKKSTSLWCEDCRFVCFETGLGLGKPMLTLNDPNGFKNTTNVYSIHLELRMALPCQISPGKWKYVNPCLDFFGIADQCTAYVKRQARPRWTYVRRSSVTPDLVIWLKETMCCIRITWCLGHHDIRIPVNHHGETQYLDSSVHLIPVCLRQQCIALISLQKSFHLAQSVTVINFLANPCDVATNQRNKIPTRIVYLAVLRLQFFHLQNATLRANGTVIGDVSDSSGCLTIH